MPFTWTPDRIIHYPLIEHVHLSPGGRRVLFTVRVAHLTEESSEFRQQIMLVESDGSGEPQAFTFGESASQPQWNPDGHTIAFLRKMPDGTHPVGLWLVSADGGEPRPLTLGFRQAITHFSWSPDGKRLAFLAPPADAQTEARKRRREDVIHWRVDHDFAHLHIVEIAPPGQPPVVTQITRDRRHVVNFDWSPDGTRLAFVHRPTPLLDEWPHGRLATIAANGSEAEPTDLGPATNWQGPLCYSPDGQWIATDVSTHGDNWPYASRAVIYPTAGGVPITLAAVSDDQPDVIGWAPDGGAVYVLNQHGLGSQVFALPTDGGAPRLCIDSAQPFELIHVNALGQVALVTQNFQEINSIYVADLAGSDRPVTLRKVAEPTAPAYLQGPLPQVQTLRWRTPDDFEIEGILYLPHDYDPASGQRIPLLLHIHGGPMSVFQRQFVGHPYYYTPAALCERGIAVLRCNPRGSGGYGQRFRFANLHDWGGGDYRDLQQGVDTVVEMGIADPARLGICGWSYGGYMTSWTITQTPRFKAASIGAPVTNPMSFSATADIPSFIPNFFGCEPWEDLAFYQAHSPIFQIQHVQTPAIIQHGDADTRVPLEQGLQYYSGLKRRGVPVEMHIYPRQGHAITEPRLLADALQRNLAWFTEQLGSSRSQ